MAQYGCSELRLDIIGHGHSYGNTRVPIGGIAMDLINELCL